MKLFSFAIPAGLFGPPLAVGLGACLWRATLPHAGWFIGIGVMASYVLMGMCLTWSLSDIGLTGALSGASTPALDPATIRYLSCMAAWLAGTAIVLLLTRLLVSKIPA